MSLTQLTDLQPTNIKVTGIATFDQTVGIAGTLTYQDVTNIDSVGLITARSGIHVSGGNVKIGTTTEGYSSADDLTISTSGTTGITIRSGTSNTGTLAFSDGTSGADEYRGYIQYEHQNDALAFGSNGTEKFRISSTGNVSIGNNATPDTLLHLQGDTPKLRIESTNTLEASAGTEEIARIEFEATKSSNRNVAASMRVRQDGTWSTVDDWFSPTAIEFYTQDQSGTEITTPRLTINRDGEVGIGTDNPLHDLEVYKVGAGVTATSVVRGENAVLAIMGDATNTGASETDARLVFSSDGDINPSKILTSPLSAHGFEIALINEEPGAGLRFHDGTANAERFRIDSKGMIGIGGVTPKTQNTFDAIEFGKTGFLGSQTGARTVEIASNAYYNSGWKYKENDVASQYYQYQGGHFFGSAGSGNADAAISFSEKFRITAGGEVLCGLTTTGTDATRNITLHAGTMMRVSNFYMGRVHQSSNNGNAAIVLHKLGQNQGFQMSGSMTFHSYTGSAYLSGCIVCRYNDDAVTRDVSLQKANSGMNLQLVEGTISGVSGTYLAIKKNGGGTGVCYINGFFGGNIEAYGGIREIASGDWTTTTVHGTGITGSNDSSSS